MCQHVTKYNSHLKIKKINQTKIYFAIFTCNFLFSRITDYIKAIYGSVSRTCCNEYRQQYWIHLYTSLLGNCVGKQKQKRFSVWSVLGSSQRVNGRPGWRSRGTPNVTSRNNRVAVFSVHGRCRKFVTDTAHRLLGLWMRRLWDWKTYVCRSAVCVQLGKRIGTSAVRLGAIAVNCECRLGERRLVRRVVVKCVE
jgi:hypothetical protein